MGKRARYPAKTHGTASESKLVADRIRSQFAPAVTVRRNRDVVAKFKASAERFVAEKSVDVIIPGEMPLNLLLADEKISSVAGATIVDGMAALMKTADMMLDLARSSQMTYSRRGYYNIQPSPQRVSEIFEFYGLSDLQKRIVNQESP